MESNTVHNFTMKQLIDLVSQDLQSLNYQITLSNSNEAIKLPTIILETPLESVLKISHSQILLKKFQMTIQCLGESKSKIMQMTDEIDNILIKRNMKKTNTVPDTYDAANQMYKISLIYEVQYNGLTNSLQS